MQESEKGEGEREKKQETDKTKKNYNHIQIPKFNFSPNLITTLTPACATVAAVGWFANIIVYCT